MIGRVCDGDDCDYDDSGTWRHYGPCSRSMVVVEDEEIDYLDWVAYHVG